MIAVWKDAVLLHHGDAPGELQAVVRPQRWAKPLSGAEWPQTETNGNREQEYVKFTDLIRNGRMRLGEEST